MAVYRPDPNLLRRQLRSIIDQSLTEWRCIVGLDGPDEAAVTLIDAEIGKDSRFEVVVFPENVGVYLNFERLLRRVDHSAAWFALADQDDYWHPLKLERLVSTLENAGASGASCQGRIVTETGIVLGQTARRSKPLTSLLIVNEVTGCLSIFRPEVLDLALPFPPNSALAIHDHWLGVCAVTLHGFCFSDNVLHDYVQHPGNTIGEQRKLKLHKALLKLLLGRVSWARVTSEPWEWRVTMAQTLLSRAAAPDTQALQAIARGSLTPKLAMLMARQVLSRHVAAPVAAALSFAAAARR
ncbi:glycosyltransferase [Terrabacter sp. LjRoot27]|uniref:glycosyltransferase n=1 Tax=Terrabacter sp. LjRoot27 TaxID=3342306 RepID=UPI003ED10DEC